MQARRNRWSRAFGLVVTFIIGASLSACSSAGQPVDPVRSADRGTQAWSARLNAQADAYRQARMWQAWTGRLDGLAAVSLNDDGMSERAQAAWSERLTKMAEAYEAGR